MPECDDSLIDKLLVEYKNHQSWTPPVRNIAERVSSEHAVVTAHLWFGCDAGWFAPVEPPEHFRLTREGYERALLLLTHEGYERALLLENSGKEFVVDEPLMIIACHKAIEGGRSPYDAVRYAWFLNVQKAQGRLVLASNRGVIAGVYRPNSQGWIPATVENFPNYGKPLPGLFGFHGTAAEDEVWNKYFDKAVPTKCRLTVPFRYCDPEP